MQLPSDDEVGEAMKFLDDPRYEVPAIVGEDQVILPKRIARMLNGVLDAIVNGDLVPLEHSAGVCCEHMPVTEKLLSEIIDAVELDRYEHVKREMLRKVLRGETIPHVGAPAAPRDANLARGYVGSDGTWRET